MREEVKRYIRSRFLLARFGCPDPPVLLHAKPEFRWACRCSLTSGTGTWKEAAVEGVEIELSQERISLDSAQEKSEEKVQCSHGSQNISVGTQRQPSCALADPSSLK